MSDHKPECIYKPENIDPAKGIRWGGSPCVCGQLRAIEQRTLDAAREAVESQWSLDPMWEGTNWNNALSAALDAIDALRESK